MDKDKMLKWTPPTKPACLDKQHLDLPLAETLITAEPPEITLSTEDCFKGQDLAAHTHFLLRISYTRWDQVMPTFGYRYHWDQASHCWEFVGRTISKAFFSDPLQLQFLNCNEVLQREFILFANTVHPDYYPYHNLLNLGLHPKRPYGVPNPTPEQERDLIQRTKIVEAHFERPQPNQTLRLHWRSARPIVERQVREHLERDVQREARRVRAKEVAEGGDGEKG